MDRNINVRKLVYAVTQTTGNGRWVQKLSRVVSIGITNLSSSPENLYVGIDENESQKFPLAPGEHVSLGPDGTGRLWDGQKLKLGFAQAAVAPAVNQAVVIITVDTGQEIC